MVNCDIIKVSKSEDAKVDRPMKKLDKEAEKIMIERFGKDTVIALATIENGIPYARYVNAYYENGAFYIITYALSNKIKHIFYV